MEIIEALETYLVETGQLHPLGVRQARIFCRSVDSADATLQHEARLFMLLCLAALQAGAPRAPGEFLTEPLQKEQISRYAEMLMKEQTGAAPPWSDMLGGEAAQQIIALVEAVLGDPGRLAPLTGKAPCDGDADYPLLVIGSVRQQPHAGFSRYWRAAVTLEERITTRLRRPFDAIPVDRAAAALKEVFVDDSIFGTKGRFHYRQIAAAALALRTPFMIVSGGPGTGKTLVVLQLLRSLVRASGTLDPRRIALCAPTGRAKARLGESIDNGIALLEHQAGAHREMDLALKNLERVTLHGLLGVRPDGSTKYDARNPLPHQVVVVDEASMVDLHLFASLMEAVSDDCRIILAGDMHQLPSVEAGAVLGDLTGCFDGEYHETLTGSTVDWLNAVMRDVAGDKAGADIAESLALPDSHSVEKAGLLADHAVILTDSYRSSGEILAVSAAVNRGDRSAALKLMGGSGQARAVVLDRRDGRRPLTEWFEEHYTLDSIRDLAALRGIDLAIAADPGHQDYEKFRSLLAAVLDNFAASRVLTVTNAGPRGRTTLNALAEGLLRPKLSGNGRGRYFHGQQVMLGRNLHDLDLYNGDTGMVLEARSGSRSVVFRRGGVCSFHPLERLTGLEAAFAMTVHKAQGSEFDHVLLALPDFDSPLLTRQILYTAITRARKRVLVLGSEERFLKAIDTKDERPGGIVLQ